MTLQARKSEALLAAAEAGVVEGGVAADMIDDPNVVWCPDCERIETQDDSCQRALSQGSGMNNQND